MADIEGSDFPIWETQGGGLVNLIAGAFIFVKAPKCPGLNIGDEMPKEWSKAPANEGARHLEKDWADFNQSLNEFFDLAFEKVENGEMGLEEMKRLFPKKLINV